MSALKLTKKSIKIRNIEIIDQTNWIKLWSESFEKWSYYWANFYFDDQPCENWILMFWKVKQSSIKIVYSLKELISRIKVKIYLYKIE